MQKITRIPNETSHIRRNTKHIRKKKGEQDKVQMPTLETHTEETNGIRKKQNREEKMPNT